LEFQASLLCPLLAQLSCDWLIGSTPRITHDTTDTIALAIFRTSAALPAASRIHGGPEAAFATLAPTLLVSLPKRFAGNAVISPVVRGVIGRRPANHRTEHGTENQGRTNEANHERAKRKAARDEQQAMSALPPIATVEADIRKRSCLLSLRKRTCAVH